MFTVLLLDNDPALYTALQEFAAHSSSGITRLLQASDLCRARELLQSGEPDIIISELLLPDGNSLELLEQLRREQCRCEFLLYTRHRDFDSAVRAMQNRAAGYVLKQQDLTALTDQLQSLISRLVEQRRLTDSDRWLSENRRRLELTFWDVVFRGSSHGRPDRTFSQLLTHGIPDLQEERHCLVVTRLTNIEQDREAFGPQLLTYAIENIHSELLCGSVENNSVICMMQEQNITVASVCPLMGVPELEAACAALLKGLHQVLSAEVTCCLCGPCSVGEMYRSYQAALDSIAANVAALGTWFWKDSIHHGATANAAADEKTISLLLAENRRQDVLLYLSERLEMAKKENQLSGSYLAAIRQDLLQCIYVDLAENDLRAGSIADNPELEALSARATRSGVDLLRWADAVVRDLIRQKQSVPKSHSLPQKVDRFISLHYREDINRERIAESLFLSPVYLGRVYKQSTGISITDRINECRITHARRLLAGTIRPIAEISEEVGFSGQAYFSTVFKSMVGMTPKEYRRSARTAAEEEL